MIVISVDDLTYWAGPNSILSGQIHAPNIQRLATEGISFANAYTPEAICNPARTSFFTGLTPNLTGVHSNDQVWYETINAASTLTARFLAAGYDVGGFGKLLHTFNMPPDVVAAMFSDYIGKTGFDGAGLIGPLPPGVTEDQTADHITIDNAIDFLRGQGPADPFMLNVGLVKPHLNWVVPQAYFDLYPLEDIEVPGLVGDDMTDVPAFIRDQLVNSNGHPVPGDVARAKEFLQGYLASLSYADAQLGRLFDELDATGRWDSTTIVLWSDHGYHLGDRDNLWGKFTLWEEATKVPFLFKLPDGAHGGRVVDDVVNLVDAYPTLLDLAGLPVPAGLSGDSLKSLLMETGPAAGDGMSVTMMFGSVMLRTLTHAYIRYEDGSQELYDMIADPDQIHNLVPESGQAGLLAQLHDIVAQKLGIVPDPGGFASGTAGVDLFYLNDAGDQAVGLGGDDTYHVNHDGVTVTEAAGGGRDTVFTRVDFTLPDHVEDLVISRYSGPGVIMVTGNGADNILTGSLGSDVIHGGAGGDKLRGGGAEDTLFGGTGNDVLVGYARADLIFGGADNDTVYGGGGNDTIHGDAGNDAIQANGPALEVFGGSGNDTITITSGSATVEGGSGADRVMAAQGASVIASYAGAGGGLSVSLTQSSANTGDAAGDVLVNVSGLQGGAGNDWLEGNTSGNLLIGGAGQDTLAGRDGDDTLMGGAGADRLDGGSGVNITDYAGSAALRASLATPADNTGDAQGDVYLGILGLSGGDGNDSLMGDAAGNLLSGRDGDDQLDGGDGDDSLFGGFGNDLLRGGAGADVIDGGAGIDAAEYAGPAGQRIDLLLPGTNSGEAAGDTLFSIERLLGGSGSDTLLGLETNEILDGRDGDDVLYGRAGNDTLVGGDGSDLVFGGLGADLIYGGAGFDTLNYGLGTAIVLDLEQPHLSTGEAAGDRIFDIERIFGSNFADWLAGTAGHDQFNGSSGNDTLFGREGDDTLSGGDGNDLLSGGAGADVFDGGSGSDTVHYASSVGQRIDLLLPGTNTGEGTGDIYIGIERLRGGSGQDTLLGYTSAEAIEGDAGNDLLYGRAGDDTLSGGQGHDRIFGGVGADLIFGGSGQDTLDFGLSMAVVLDLQEAGLNTAEAAGDQIFGVEQINGSAFADVLAGDAENNRLDGSAGHDTLFGRDGGDILWGGAGDDWLYGGAGPDRLIGGAGLDTVVYGSADGLLVDMVRRSQNTGEAAGDRLTGVEAVITGAGNDTLAGTNDSETLDGGSGQDVLIGRAGNDTLRGGSGNDTLFGGAGRDVFVFEAGADILRDWSLAEADLIAIDRSVLGGLTLTGAEIVATHAAVLGRNVVLDFGDGSVLTLDRALTLDGLADLIYSF